MTKEEIKDAIKAQQRIISLARAKINQLKNMKPTAKKLSRSVKKFRLIDKHLMQSGLPNSLDLDDIKSTYGLDTVIDLSDRPRPVVANWCDKNEVKYIKHQVDKNNPQKADYKNALENIKGQTLVFCFHGSTRSSTLVALHKIKQGQSATKVIDQLRVTESGMTEPMLQLIAELSFEI